MWQFLFVVVSLASCTRWLSAPACRVHSLYILTWRAESIISIIALVIQELESKVQANRRSENWVRECLHTDLEQLSPDEKLLPWFCLRVKYRPVDIETDTLGIMENSLASETLMLTSVLVIKINILIFEIKVIKLCNIQEAMSCLKCRWQVWKQAIMIIYKTLHYGICFNFVKWLHGSVARMLHTYDQGPLTRYVKMWVAHAPGMSGTFSTPLRVSDPDIVTWLHGTCMMHVPSCMPGSLTIGFLWSRWRG